jgi:Na+-driven multidrug efflux pump
MWFVSGVAVGSGWQAIVAFVNIGSYYIVGVPLGVLLGWLLGFGIRVRVFHCYQHFNMLGSMYSIMVNRTTVVFLNLP